MTHEEFVAQFGGIFEHSPWIAERAFELELGPAHDSAGGLHNALCRDVPRRKRDRAARRAQCPSGPCRQACRGQAADRGNRRREQASAGLDALTDEERELFSKLNAAYVTTFGFPFIIAVKGKTKDEILAAFERRIGNDRATEFDTACRRSSASRCFA